MKQIVIRDCQIRDSLGKILTVVKDELVEYKGEHPYLRSIEGETAEEIDFDTAQEDELLETEYDLKDLKAYIIKKYEVKLRLKSKQKIVDKLLDLRYRAVDDFKLK